MFTVSVLIVVVVPDTVRLPLITALPEAVTLLNTTFDVVPTGCPIETTPPAIPTPVPALK